MQLKPEHVALGMNQSVLERIADLADIDTRRAMGFEPRKLPHINFDPKPMPSIEYRYYINEKRLWYFEMYEYMHFLFEVSTGVEVVDPAVPSFRYTDKSRQRYTVFNERRTENTDVPIVASDWMTFQTAGYPIWIS